MATGFQILASDGVTNVGAETTGHMRVTTPQTLNSTNSTKVGYTFLAAGPQNRAIQSVGPMGRLATGAQTLELFDPIDGAAINSMIWSTPAPTGAITVAQSATTGLLSLNSGSVTTINTACQISTIKQMQLINTFVPTLRMLFSVTNSPQANSTTELGFIECSGSTAPTNGAFFRWSSASEFRCVNAYNSVETTSAALTAPTITTIHTAHIVFRGTKVEYWLDEVLVAEVAAAAGQPNPTATSRLTIAARVYIGGSVPSVAPVLNLGAVILWRNDLQTNKLWPSQMVGVGRGLYQAPLTPYAQTANHANSTSPTSASLSNTVAGYTTLGGRWQFAALAGAVTDFALFGYQVPTGVQMFITDFRFDSVNTGATVATTPTIIDVGVGLNSSAVSLATADSFTTQVYGPRRIPLGQATWVVGDLAGAASRGTPIDFNLVTAWEVDSARFFHVIIQIYAGTATASQVIRGDCYVGGYFE